MHLAVSERACELQQAVSQSAFAVIDVGNNAKIANVIHSLHFSPLILGRKGSQNEAFLNGTLALNRKVL
jgi:hypothetical protein